MNATAKLPDCTEEFFVDTQIPMTFEYNTDAECDTVINHRPAVVETIEDVFRNFSECKNRTKDGCGIKYLTLNCTGNGANKKVTLSFEIYLKNVNNQEIGPNCDPNCLRTNMRGILQDTLLVKNKFEATVKERNERLESIEGLEMRVNVKSFKYSQPRLLCMDEGEVYTSRRTCSPCGKGTYLAKPDAQSCTPCAIGTFQDKTGQTECKKCLEGSTTAAEGSDHSSLCSVREAEISSNRRRKRRSLHSAPMMSQEEIDEILSFLG
jgi:ribosomal protein S27AE